MHRNQGTTSWITKAVLHALAGLTAGAAAGAALGLLGSRLPLDVRAAAAAVLGVTAVVVGAAELWSPRTRGPRGRDRETPQRWMDMGPLRWAARNGIALGLGFTSRLGFWLWFVVPLTGLLSGSLWVGALAYGLYGFSRTALPGAVMAAAIARPGWEYDLWLLRRGMQARSLAAGNLVLTGAAVSVGVGL
ncbi:MAG TPA: hypothetical protein VHN37_14075 [Actinomycetota bacterium]|nr:hypothetical protein [Actinomycetota bacterium]